MSENKITIPEQEIKNCSSHKEYTALLEQHGVNLSKAYRTENAPSGEDQSNLVIIQRDD